MVSEQRFGQEKLRLLGKQRETAPVPEFRENLLVTRLVGRPVPPVFSIDTALLLLSRDFWPKTALWSLFRYFRAKWCLFWRTSNNVGHLFFYTRSKSKAKFRFLVLFPVRARQTQPKIR